MYCTFFGHREAPLSLKDEVKKAVEDLFLKCNIKDFCVGNNGNFDYIVQSVLQNLIDEGLEIDYIIYTSRIDELALNKHQEKTIFPEGLETTPKRFAIVRRNDLLIKKSNYLICYVNHIASNSYKLRKKAEKYGLIIIDINTQTNSNFM